MLLRENFKLLKSCSTEDNCFISISNKISARKNVLVVADVQILRQLIDHPLFRTLFHDQLQNQQWDEEFLGIDEDTRELSSNDIKFWGSCPGNWHRYGVYCYKWFGKERKENWMEAELRCRRSGGHLVSIENELQSDIISGITMCKNDYWIGLVNTEYDRGAFTDPQKGWSWWDGSQTNYTRLDIQDIIGFDCTYATTKGSWENSYCSHVKKSWVCKKFSSQNETEDGGTRRCSDGWVYYKGNCYKFSKTKSNYFHAQLNCRNEKATAVTIHSEHEQQFIQAIQGCEKPFWIGLELSKPCVSEFSMRSTTCWQWTDLSKVTYKNWATNMPKDARFNECVFSDGYWENTQCYAQKYYICKKAA